MFTSVETNPLITNDIAENTTKSTLEASKTKVKRVCYCQWIPREDDPTKLEAKWMFDQVIVGY